MTRHLRVRPLLIRASLFAAVLSAWAMPSSAQFGPTLDPNNTLNPAQSQTTTTTNTGTTGPRQALPSATAVDDAALQRMMQLQTTQLPGSPAASRPEQSELPPPAPYVPGEFETYVQGLAPSQTVKRLGADLMRPSPDGGSHSPLVPPDYLIVPGDELDVNVWGSVDAQVATVVDSSGRITLPRVGTVMVSGTRYADLPALLKQQVGKVFRNFNLSVSLGQLRGMRVFVTGFVARPGSYTLSSLATVSTALIDAGGPTAAGSFRDVEVRRGGQVVTHFDLYDLVLKGNRDADIVLQPDDVLHVGPVGPQVGVIGSVNQPAVIELKGGEDLADVLRMAGGITSVADASRITIEPLGDRNAERVKDLNLAQAASQSIARGDVINVYSLIDPRQPTVSNNKRVTVEGEVAHPGVYVMKPGATLADAVAMAGGLTPKAYLWGTDFTRHSVLVTQQQNYEKVLSDLEVSLMQTVSTTHVGSADDAKAQDARATATQRLIAKLRQVKPTGRVVLVTDPDVHALPAMQVEDDDRLYIPAVPTSVGVFGSVYNTGNFVFTTDRRIGDYLDMAGGPTRGADKDAAFVLRANGSVVSNLQGSGWFSTNYLRNLPALPGDTVFVPEELDKLNGLEVTKGWTQIVYQLGLGLAGVASAIR